MLTINGSDAKLPHSPWAASQVHDDLNIFGFEFLIQFIYLGDEEIGKIRMGADVKSGYVVRGFSQHDIARITANKMPPFTDPITLKTELFNVEGGG